MSKVLLIIAQNTVCAVFLLFQCLGAAALTKMPQTVPEYHFLVKTGVEYVAGKGAGLAVETGAGINSKSSLHCTVPAFFLVQTSSANAPVTGDITVSYRYMLYQSRLLLFSAESSLLLPSSRNMYRNDEYHHLITGVNQLSQYFIVQKSFENIAVTANVSYNMIADRNEDFFSGFYINPIELKTYQNALGLNPFSEESFLSTDRLVNDWYSLSCSLRADYWYPFAFQVELYYSSFFDSTAKEGDPEVEGGKLRSLISAASLMWNVTPERSLNFIGSSVVYSSSARTALYTVAVSASLLF